MQAEELKSGCFRLGVTKAPLSPEMGLSIQKVQTMHTDNEEWHSS